MRRKGDRRAGWILRVYLRELDDAFELEGPLFAAKVTVCDQHQLAIGTAHVKGLDDPLGSGLAGIQVFHHDGLALLEGFFKFEREQAFARVINWEEAHRAALLADSVAQAHFPPPYRLHEAFKNQCCGDGICQGAVGAGGLHAQARGEGLKAISASTESTAGDANRIKNRRVVEGLGNVVARATKFFSKEGEVEPDVMAEDHSAIEQFHGRGKLLGEGGLAIDHLLGDAGENGNPGADATLGVDELLILGDLHAVLVTDNSQFNHSMAEVGGRARGLHVQEGVGDRMQGLEE